MRIDLGTPALLFPAISLLLLAYTNRFLALATLIRGLRAAYAAEPSGAIARQISNLRRRVYLIRDMQILGVLSLLLCVAGMFLLFLDHQRAGKLFFGGSLLLMLASLGVSILELWISVRALEIHLSDMEGNADADESRV
ncbi:MAG: DUF2721 domain-containing protein [Deltaproteobacteria bacterium]|nr:DUF2721 domain-containing protein [Deltaproteobacteria bacterium]